MPRDESWKSGGRDLTTFATDFLRSYALRRWTYAADVWPCRAPARRACFDKGRADCLCRHRFSSPVRPIFRFWCGRHVAVGAACGEKGELGGTSCGWMWNPGALRAQGAQSTFKPGGDPHNLALPANFPMFDAPHNADFPPVPDYHADGHACDSIGAFGTRTRVRPGRPMFSSPYRATIPSRQAQWRPDGTS